jgi:hypothetical protein
MEIHSHINTNTVDSVGTYNQEKNEKIMHHWLQKRMMNKSILVSTQHETMTMQHLSTCHHFTLKKKKV